MKTIKIENKFIGQDYPTYFIADVAANHDGDLERAKDLIFYVQKLVLMLLNFNILKQVLL